jgi:hypothetical protein
VRPKTTSQDQKPLVTSVNGAMDMLSVGKNTVFELIRDGEIEVARLYGRTLPVVASLERLIQRGGTKKRIGRARPGTGEEAA